MIEGMAMGKYGAYVWASFGLTVLVFVIVEWRTRARQRKIYRDVALRIRASEGSS
jgi:heme exporter protein CcmD